MQESPHIWLRAETKPNEKRTPLTPVGAQALLDAGYSITVEEDPLRVFDLQHYRNLGCDIAAAGSWNEAPLDVFVLGLKELDAGSTPLPHRHIHFAHVFKNQSGSSAMLSRFRDGGGSLYDLEYLVGEDGRRVAAFGYWAGFCGAALGVMAYANQHRGMKPPLQSIGSYSSKEDLLAAVGSALEAAGFNPSVMVIGARGRSGNGAVELCRSLSLDVVEWDMAETQRGGPFQEINAVDVLVNCVFVSEPLPPFVTLDTLAKPRALSVISDVSCDPYGSYNPLPIYHEITNFDQPTIAIDAGDDPLDLIAIDHLPSMLPKESSEDYGSQLLPSLLALDKPDSGVWGRAQAVFTERCHSLLGPKTDA